MYQKMELQEGGGGGEEGRRRRRRGGGQYKVKVLPCGASVDLRSEEKLSPDRRRCSCATFLDKECVYFCHLDIIWVNTPERVVSYGLGNAPRTKRAAVDSLAASSGARCRCFHEDDDTCRTFCRAEPVHSTRSATPRHRRNTPRQLTGTGLRGGRGRCHPPPESL
ncbi:hypothetical protein INR49_011614 [Caranx melampygus]|nr:hypothetical protein INR49_011614 [Caranx melampygus]